MDLNLIMTSDEFAFKGININNHYRVKNIAKYNGKDTNLKYTYERERKYMQELDGDDNIVIWSYKQNKIAYIDQFTGQNDFFYPSFYVMTKGKELEGIKKEPLKDWPYNEYIVHLVADDEYMSVDLLDDDDYYKLSIEEQEYYTYYLMQEQYNYIRYQAANNYCKSKAMRFILTYPDGTVCSILPTSKYH